MVHNLFCEPRHTFDWADYSKGRRKIQVSTHSRKKITEYLIILGLFLATGAYLAFSPLFPG